MYNIRTRTTPYTHTDTYTHTYTYIYSFFKRKTEAKAFFLNPITVCIYVVQRDVCSLYVC